MPGPGLLGAFFMAFLAVTLLWILNSDRVPDEWRNKAWSNIVLALITLAFAVLAVQQLRDAISSVRLVGNLGAVGLLLRQSVLAALIANALRPFPATAPASRRSSPAG